MKPTASNASHPTSAAALSVMIGYVRPLSRHLLRATEARLAGTGLTVPQRGLLERLYEAGPQTVPALGRSLMIPRQFAQRLVDEAAAGGFVARLPNAAHRRSPLIALTEGGRTAIEGVLAAEAAALEGLAGRFESDDVDAATHVLERLAAAFADLAAEAGPPLAEEA